MGTPNSWSAWGDRGGSLNPRVDGEVVMMGTSLAILVFALVFYILSIIWAVYHREFSAVYFAVMAAVTLYVLGAALALGL